MDQLRAAYNTYGGSARNLFTKTVLELERDIATAIVDHPDLGTLFKYQSGFPDATSNALITINPREDEYGVIRRDYFEAKFTSRAVLDRLLSLQENQSVDQMTKIFNMLFNSGSSRSAAGILFEGAGHEYLREALKSPLQVRSLTKGNGDRALDLLHVGATRQFRVSDIGPFAGLSATDYYRPVISTFASIDSFALEINRLGKPTSVIFFLFTVCYNHPVKTTFLSNLWVPYSRARDWKLVFVVPEVMASNYEPAQLDRKWEPRISQYVLGVDIKSLWAARL